MSRVGKGYDIPGIHDNAWHQVSLQVMRARALEHTNHNCMNFSFPSVLVLD